MQLPNLSTRRLVVLLSFLVVCLSLATGQTVSKNDREVGKIMLRNVRDSVKKNYYDPEFHGVNLDEAFKIAEQNIDGATANGQILGIIEKALLGLNDSHTAFLPPPHAMRVSYDWDIRMIGDRCYVMAVKPGTDAEAKGLKAGDILHVVDGYKIARENFWQFNYLYNFLQPKQELSLVVQSPGEQPRRVVYNASTRQGPKALDLTNSSIWYEYIRERQQVDWIYEHQFKAFGHDLYIWKMPKFDLTVGRVNEIMETVGKYKTLIIDLRGNGGGYVETLLQLVGNFFDHDVKIGDRKGRKEMKAETAKTRGHGVFTGQLIVLVDSRSASASELFARVVQIEKKGIVIGDVTAGAVMEARVFPFSVGESSLVLFAVEITDADIIMTDGKSLEHTGVTPDKIMLPTGADLREQADPVLSYAASLAGMKLDPKEAGALFPVRWKLKP
jgi:C-terminal processing protease CtpA/Prc